MLQHQEIPLNMLIEGHADDIPVIKGITHWLENWSLGLFRANSVFCYIKKNVNSPHTKLLACSLQRVPSLNSSGICFTCHPDEVGMRNNLAGSGADSGFGGVLNSNLHCLVVMLPYGKPIIGSFGEVFCMPPRQAREPSDSQ